MSLILNIDTALPRASLCLAKDGMPLQILENDDQKDHAKWLHTAVQEMLKNNKHLPSDLEAVAVSMGPGSYTGLRVGLAAAKGLCYALQIPLITINTLELIASAVKGEATELIIPLIDARRMEVYTAVYDVEIREKISTYVLVLEPGSFSELLSSNKIIFCGNGVPKLQPMLLHVNASYSQTIANAGHLAPVSQQNFVKSHFASLAYSEPLYVKDFHSPAKE